LKVLWTAEAKDALARACLELRLLSTSAADDLGDRATRASERLAEFPDSGRIVPEFGVPLLREVIISRYRLVYERLPDRIAVIAFHPAALPFDAD
jgi:plasmid stabilization system protein ParE